jgi:hypothetical protein
MSTLVEDLVSQGVCTPEVVEAVSRQLAAQGSGRLTDSLALMGWAEEKSVLRVLAGRSGTKFVTVEKLRAAKVEQGVLDRVPVQFAEAQSALPLKVDAATRTLIVAVADPSNQTLLSDIKLVSGAANVVALVALERGIQAAVRRFYYGDITAFESLAKELVPPRTFARVKDTKEASLSKVFTRPPPDKT